MSNPHLVSIYYNGEYKMAECCHYYQGLEEGAGVNILRFLNHEMDRSKFLKRVAKLQFFTEKQEKAFYKSSKTPPYHLSRGITAVEILKFVQDQERYKRLKLLNRIDVSKKYYCEWGYIIDFDKDTYEIYAGYNNSPLSNEERFYHDGFLETINHPNGIIKIYPIKHIQSFSLSKLPDEEEFIEIMSMIDINDLCGRSCNE